MKPRHRNLSAMAKRTYGTGSLFQRGKTWWIQIRLGTGERYRESSYSRHRSEADKLLKIRLAELASGKTLLPGRVTVGQLCDLVIEDYRLRKQRSVRHVIWRSDRHIRPIIGGIRASKFGTEDLKRYVVQRRGEKAGDATVNRELAIIRRGFSLAYHSEPPLVNRIPAIKKFEEENVREGFIEQDEYRVLLAALPNRLKCLLVVGYHVGNRLGELLNLHRTQADLRAREIRLKGKQTKGKKPRTLPVYGDMGPWLEMQLAELEQHWPNCPWLFHYQGRRVGRHLKGWKEACETVGLHGLRFHDLRRSAVRNMERAGVPRRVAMAISGHKTEEVYRRYDIVAPQDLRTAAEKLETYLGEPGLATSLATKPRMARQ